MRIEAKNLCRNYKGFALNNVTLTVEPNRTIGLVGPNGSGKTTLIHCLIGIEKPSSGLIKMDVSRRTLYKKIGVQLQDGSYHSKIRLYEMLDLILVNGDGNWAYVDTLLEKFNLLKKKKAYVSNLSGGEKQKFSLVAALANRPELLFLDEVTSNVDQINRKDIIQFLNELKESGQSIVMTSHYLDELEAVCDYFVFLKDGEVLGQGTKNDLIKALNVKSEMHPMSPSLEYMYEAVYR
ncbi:ABC transporter ATP-binding protein [Alicyclobacillus sp. SO9]|uniref:ABC transporter ATP-binding protein n=1 Tax=Alicyclobacillus sp. SO9 TaxID=2665646 RepID=UPI0018E8930D|nr:ABC transporter ATP-binding protein [Alicyclobacillus sp. SO9]QQE79284.1 ABC transporter ATP-binding protein [Alicyclobacillus sp. SO9]